MNKKIIINLILTLIFIFGIASFSNVKAASVNLNVPDSVTTGDTITATITGTAEQWNLTLTANGTTIASTDNLTNEGSEISISKSGTYTTTSSGTVTLVLEGDYSYTSDGNVKTKEVSVTKTVTVKAKEVTPEPTPSDPETPDTPSEPENPTPTQPEKPSEPETPAITEPNFTSTNQTVYAKSGTGSVNLRASWSTTSAATNVKNGTELTLTGTSTETVNGYVWYRVTYNGQTKYVASGLVTTTKPEEKTEEKQPETPVEEPKSSNVNLKELKVNVEGLTPEFKKDVKEYTLNVGADVEKIEVTAVPEDEKSKVSVSGNEEIKTGENLVLITVNAEDGTTTIYEIKVIKAASEGLKLSKLEIADYTLSPKFNPDVFEYKLNVVAVDKLDITAEASEETATIEIVGNTELQNGENLVTIIVKSEDGEKTTTYQITVNKRETLIATKSTNDDNNLNKIILAVAALIVIIILVLVLTIFKKKKSSGLGPENYYHGTYDDKEDEDDYESYDNYNEDYNNYGKEEYSEELTYDDNNFNADNDDDDDDDFGGKRGKHF